MDVSVLCQVLDWNTQVKSQLDYLEISSPREGRGDGKVRTFWFHLSKPAKRLSGYC